MLYREFGIADKNRKVDQMATYKDEEVLTFIEAQIHPIDNSVPDCRCVIRLTSMHVYVSEDNFDGTFTDHYVFDNMKIDEILIDTPYATSVKLSETHGESDGFGTLKWSVSNSLIGKLLSRRKGGTVNSTQGNKEARKYLKIVYRDENGKIEHLYFDECSKNPASFIKVFESMR
jgi:hypothetical protein